MRQWDKSKPPTGLWTLNRDCPQAQGLVSWWPFANSGGVYSPDYAGIVHMSGGTSPTYTLTNTGGHAVSMSSASSQYLNNSSIAAVTAAPLTLAAWWRPATHTASQNLICLANTGSVNEIYELVWDQSTSAAWMLAGDASRGTQFASKSLTPVDGTWYHLCGVERATNSRDVYVNGSVGTANTNTAIPSVNETMLGVQRFGGNNTKFLNGLLADALIWNLDIGQTNISRLNDPGLRFELYYPLRSRKWISLAPTLPTLSNATYKAGTLTSVGFTPEVTAS